MYINSMYRKSNKKSLKIKKIKKTKNSQKNIRTKGKRKAIFRLCCRTNKFKKYLVY